MDELSVNIIWLFVTNLVLGSLLIVVIGLSVSQRLSYRRRLRAAKIAAYGRDAHGVLILDSILTFIMLLLYRDIRAKPCLPGGTGCRTEYQQAQHEGKQPDLDQ